MSTVGFRPTDPEQLADLLAGLLHTVPAPGFALRVGLDGPVCVAPCALAGALTDPLRTRGRPVTVIRADTFWRDASLRLEYGRTDLQSYTESWLDVGSLTREVLHPLGPGGSGAFLPSLRDPVSSRSTRVPREDASPGAVVIVCGELLLGRGLEFDPRSTSRPPPRPAAA